MLDEVVKNKKKGEAKEMKRALVMALMAMLVMTMTGSAFPSATGINNLVWEHTTANLGAHDIAYHDGLFVAVGGHILNAMILSSRNGIDWDLQLKKAATARGSFTLRSIVYGNGLWVVAGGAEGSRSGIIITSRDGISWTSQTVPYVLRDVIYASGSFIAVGNVMENRPVDGVNQRLSAPIILVSQDGEEWERQTLPKRESLMQVSSILWSITYGNGKWVAVGSPGVVLASKNARNWEWGNNIPMGSAIHIAYGNGVFVVLPWKHEDATPILVSRDLISWHMIDVSVAGSMWQDLDYVVGRFIAIASNDKVFHSWDGMDWEYTLTDRVTRIRIMNAPIYHNGVFVTFGWRIDPHRTTDVKRGIVFARAPLLHTALQLRIGSPELVIEQGNARKMITLDAVPEVPGAGRTFLPIRPIVESLGGQISWFEADRRVEIRSGENNIVLWLGNPNALVNGQTVQIDQEAGVVPYVSRGRTMLPLRFVAEALGAKVLWNWKTQGITIVYP